MANPSWRAPEGIIEAPALRASPWLAARVREMMLKRNKFDVPKAVCEAMVHALCDAIRLGVESGDRVQLRGVGTLQAVWRKPRVGRNPINGARIEIPRVVKCAFKAPAEWNDALTLRCGGDASKPVLEFLAREGYERRKAGENARYQ